jgi:hypothetical protein
MALEVVVKSELKSIEELTKWGGVRTIFMFDEESEPEFEDIEDFEDIDLDGKKAEEEENLYEEGMYEDSEEESEEDEDFEPFADYDDDDDAAVEQGEDI